MKEAKKTFREMGDDRPGRRGRPRNCRRAPLALCPYSRSPPQVASVEKMAFPLPDRPSIAVLPFENLSADKSQDYIVDGMTEDIISALARFKQLFVIARNSTLTYKGKAVKVQQVAEELGVAMCWRAAYRSRRIASGSPPS